MLPSLLTREIQTGLKQFLVSGFEPADAFMRGLMTRFTEDEAAWLKGPFGKIGLPFALGFRLKPRSLAMAASTLGRGCYECR